MLTTEYVQTQLKVQIRTLQINLREMTSKKGRVSFQADFRAFHSVGGRREILREPGSGNVVRCPVRAQELFEEMLRDFAARALNAAPNQLPFDPPIGRAAREYLIAKAKNGGRASSTLAIEAAALKRFRTESGNARLSRITSGFLEGYIERRKETAGSRTGTLCSPSTIRKELMALSGMFEYAVKRDLARVNPVRKIAFLPSVQRTQGQSSWLRGDEPDRLLDAAAILDAETREARRIVAEYRTARQRGEPVAAPTQQVFAAARRFAWCEAVICTYLYTGGRLMEILGLTVEDIDFTSRRVRFESNEHRRLKKRHHRRRVELWSPLRDTLEHYIAERGVTAGLLFASERGGMMRSFRKALTRCFERAGLASPGRLLSTHSLRHTYATRMLCTLVKSEKGRWAERSADNVRRKLGHRTSDLVERVYGHETDGERRWHRLWFERSRKLPAKRLRAEGAALVAC